MYLDGNHLNEIENYVKHQHLENLDLNCDHVELYKQQEKFTILSGHRALLLNWCQNIQVQGQNNEPTEPSFETFILNHPAFTPIMRVIFLTTLRNHKKSANARRFPDVLMNFSIYIYIMAGKASYEIICANIPLPKAGTISKFHLKNLTSQLYSNRLLLNCLLFLNLCSLY